MSIIFNKVKRIKMILFTFGIFYHCAKKRYYTPIFCKNYFSEKESERLDVYLKKHYDRL